MPSAQTLLALLSADVRSDAQEIQLDKAEDAPVLQHPLMDAKQSSAVQMLNASLSKEWVNASARPSIHMAIRKLDVPAHLESSDAQRIEIALPNKLAVIVSVSTLVRSQLHAREAKLAL